jgi:hypothetical protein
MPFNISWMKYCIFICWFNLSFFNEACSLYMLHATTVGSTIIVSNASGRTLKWSCRELLHGAVPAFTVVTKHLVGEMFKLKASHLYSMSYNDLSSAFPVLASIRTQSRSDRQLRSLLQSIHTEYAGQLVERDVFSKNNNLILHFCKLMHKSTLWLS